MTVHSPIVRTTKTIVEAEVQSMALTHVHMTVHSPIVRTTKTIVEAEVQSMPLTQVRMTVHSPIVRKTKTIVEADVQSMPLTQVHMTVHSPIALYGRLNKKGADLNRVYSVSTVCVHFVLYVKYICCSLYRCCLCILLVL